MSLRENKIKSLFYLGLRVIRQLNYLSLRLNFIKKRKSLSLATLFPTFSRSPELLKSHVCTLSLRAKMTLHCSLIRKNYHFSFGLSDWSNIHRMCFQQFKACFFIFNPCHPFKPIVNEKF